MKKDFEEAGFINVKMWYQPTNFLIPDFDAYWDWQSQSPFNPQILLDESAEITIKVKAEMKESFDKASSSLDVKEFEVLVIIAEKN